MQKTTNSMMNEEQKLSLAAILKHALEEFRPASISEKNIYEYKPNPHDISEQLRDNANTFALILQSKESTINANCIHYLAYLVDKTQQTNSGKYKLNHVYFYSTETIHKKTGWSEKSITKYNSLLTKIGIIETKKNTSTKYIFMDKIVSALKSAAER